MKNFYLKNLQILPVVLFALAVTGCDSQRPTSTKNAAPTPIQQISNRSVWDHMSSNFQMKTHSKNPRVQYFIKMYTKPTSKHLATYSGQAKPYLYHVVSVLEETGMPAELALLPMVESEYRPLAKSSVGAAGIWQLALRTGRLYGLKDDRWYDGRRDIDAATRAATEHLQFLYEKFDNDWLLALAAYNAGGARVEQAIRKNKKLGKPTDYWSLSLPKETMHFVPKFLAITYLIQNSRVLGIELEPIVNQPYFTQVQLNSPIDFHTAATLAQIDVAEVKRLNPAHHTHKTHPNGPHQILLPVQHASIFRANFVSHKAKLKTQAKKSAVKAKAAAKTSNVKITNTVKTTAVKSTTVKATTVANTHTVNSGDTLHKIAAKYRTTPRAIKQKNKLKSDIIRSGQLLAI